MIELPPFSQKWGQYRLTEEDRTIMIEAILSDPEGWPLQKGTGGARKARFASQELDRGASGGYRVFYAVFRKHGKVVLITLFPKNQQANLSKAGQNLVARVLQEMSRSWNSSREKKRLASESGESSDGPTKSSEPTIRPFPRQRRRLQDGRGVPPPWPEARRN